MPLGDSPLVQGMHAVFMAGTITHFVPAIQFTVISGIRLSLSISRTNTIPLTNKGYYADVSDNRWEQPTTSDQVYYPTEQVKDLFGRVRAMSPADQSKF